MKLTTRFPGGSRVDTEVRGFRIATDQPVQQGGADSAAAPFELFLASLVTCAGYYAVQFCNKREIPTEGLGVTLDARKDPETGLLGEVRLEIELPEGFPEKYRHAIVRAVDRCAVKRAFDQPPRFSTSVHESPVAA